MQMRAIVYRQHGDIEKLEEIQKPRPVPKRNQALIEVRAIGLNPLDYRLRRGEIGPLTRLQGPRLTGSDFAGVIVETGGPLEGFQVGDRVMGMVNQIFTGVSADFIVVDQKHLCPCPENVDDNVAATIPLASYTAYQGLHECAAVGPGQRVLINGASGGVGTYATQFAAIAGAEVTTVTSHRNVDWMKAIGATNTVDYTKTDFTSLNDRFDIVFDCYGNRSFSKVRPVLEKNGVYITTIPSPRSYAWSMPNPFRQKKSRVVVVKSKPMQLSAIKDLIESKALRPMIDSQFERHLIHEAYARLESKRSKGKICVAMHSAAV